MTREQAYEKLNITVDLIPAGNSNRPGRPLKATNVTIHNTDNSDKGATARAHANYLKGEDARKRKVSWHYTVDDAQTFKHLPLSEQGWHAGTSKGNQCSIGIEICQFKGIDQRAANERAALLTALLLAELNLEIGCVVPHKHWSGKDCPKLLLHPNTSWDGFLEEVSEYLQALKQVTQVRAAAAPKNRSGYRKFVTEIQSAFPPEISPFPSGAAEIQLPDGPSFVLNARPDVPDFRDQYFIPTLVQVPPTLSLAEYKKANVPILDQGQEGACTGFGLATVANYLFRQLNPKTAKCASPRMLYEMAKRYDEWAGEAYEGSSARGAMKGWNKHGICDEAKWPYSSTSQHESLTPDRAKAAAENPMGAYFRVDHKDIVAMHAAIAEVGILYATATVHSGWQRVGSDGIIPRDTKIIGGHAFAIVGYDEQGFWIQNSWGPTWGKEGFCRIGYDDWLENGSDVWVARLGVPITFADASGPTIASNYLSGDSKPVMYQLLRPHVVCLDNDGLLAQNGEFANSVATLSELVGQMKKTTKNWSKKRILIYAHGGLVEEKGFLKVLSSYRETMLEKEVYPICFVWRTGLLDTIRQIIEDAVQSRMPAGSFMELVKDRLDDVIEVVSAIPGRLCWSEMKENAIQATVSRDGGARQLANLLKDLDDSYEIHLAAHSAGSIHLAPFAQLWCTNGPIQSGPMQTSMDPASRLNRDIGFGKNVESCTLWAPAIRNDLFEVTYAPLVRNGKINRLAVYSLTDRAERDDNCVGVYSKSLLYLVSHAFESVRNAPILGMEIYQKPVLTGLRNTSVVFAKYDPHFEFKPGGVIPDTASQSRHHGDFDDDPATLWSTLARIEGTNSITI
ncbi:MAG: N-acetylmuramoyl-L-alanine amidase [Armatimonadetes bacterium]|nr:N-acetylmuramoyl-L-alanine amidase [Armatimonadota bacterium]